MTGKYYRHFNGDVYLVLHIAKHSERLEDIVVYQAIYGERKSRSNHLFQFALSLNETILTF